MTKITDPNADIKNQLGNEYDLYSSLKDKFQGFDKNGDAVFKDEAGTTSFSKSDFSKMNAQLQKDFGQKSYEDTFNQNQYEDIAKQGNKFQGFSGDQAIFRNEKGDLENFGNKGGFAEFLKKQQAGNTFDMAKQGESQRKTTDYAANLGFLDNKVGTQQKTGSGFTGYNPQEHLNNVSRKMVNPSEAEDDSGTNPNIPTPGSLEGVSKPAAPKASGSFNNFQRKQKIKTQPVQAPPPTLGDVATGMAKDAAGKEIQAQKTDLQNKANQQISTATGLDTLAITNPQEYAKQQAVSAAKDQAKNLVLDQITPYDPTGGALSGLGSVSQYAKLLNGNVAQNVQKMATNNAVDYAKQQATGQALAAAGLDPTGGAATAALAGLKGLTGGGSSEQKGQAAAEAAARGTMAAMTGGLANPELMHAGAALTDQAAGKLGSAGVLLKPTSAALDLGAQGLDLGIKSAGQAGAGYGRDFSQANTGLKSIAKGNIEEGLKSLGSGAANAALQTFLKNPATIAEGVGNLGKAAVQKAKSIANAAGNAVSKVVSWVCFTPDTEILMANGKYKKIKQIKLGEEVMLGGKVTAIGTAMANDLYLYDGVEVSEGHALYEDGIWVRVEDSKYAVKIDQEEEFLVYPMATENHLVVTKNQVWADIMETDDKHNKSEDDRIADLNSQTQANKMIDMFLDMYFKKKKNGNKKI